MEAPPPSPAETEAASKPIAAWAPDAMTRRITVEKRTIRARRKNPHLADFTEYRVRALLGALFWQGFFIIVIKVGRNTPAQQFILGNSYANGVPNSAIHVFSKYFMLLKCNFDSARAGELCCSTDKMGSSDRIWSLE